MSRLKAETEPVRKWWENEEGGWRGRVMMQRAEWKQGESVQGENILELAGDAEDLLSVVLCMKKLKGETKTDNMPTVNKEMTEWRHSQHGIMGALSEERLGAARAGGWTRAGSKMMAGGHAHPHLKKKSVIKIKVEGDEGAGY